MKKSTCFLIGLLCLVSSNFLLAQQSQLNVLDPHSWSSSDQATIEEASLTIKPKGMYMEYGLYLTLSPNGSYFDGVNYSDLEFEMFFELPERSIVHDSWLWVDGQIMQALLIDRQKATEIYEGIVSRRKDPSILYQNGNGTYELRVYPVSGSGSRKLKITYLVETNWGRNRVSTPLPLDILKLSSKVPTLEMTIYTDDDFGSPRIDELDLISAQQTTNGLGVHYLDIPSYALISNDDLSLSYTSPLTNDGVFVAKHESGNSEGYYQAIVSPSQMSINSGGVRKLAVALDLKTNQSHLSQDEYLGKVKSMLMDQLLPTDSFALFFSTITSAYQTNNTWLAATPNNINSMISIIPSNFLQSNGTGLNLLLNKSINFVKNNGSNGELLLVSNNNDITDHQQATAFFTGLFSSFNFTVPPINVVNFFEQIPYSGNPQSYEQGNEYLFRKFSDNTGGSYIEHVFEEYNSYDPWTGYYTNYRRSTSIRDLLNGSLHAIYSNNDIMDVVTDITNGLCYDEYSAGVTSNTTITGVIKKIGQYYGSDPIELKVVTGYQGQLTVTNYTDSISRTADSCTRKMWAAHLVKDLEDQSHVRDAIDASREHRVLSRYTAFLALEPNDTLSACENCVDDSGQEGQPTVGMNELMDETTAFLFPNPFTIVTTIELSLPSISGDELVEIRIYDISGKLVKTMEERTENGELSIVWEGENEGGETVAKGTYLIVISSESFNKTFRVVKH